jgi:hypothetical protein
MPVLDKCPNVLALVETIRDRYSMLDVLVNTLDAVEFTEVQRVVDIIFDRLG